MEIDVMIRFVEENGTKENIRSGRHSFRKPRTALKRNQKIADIISSEISVARNSLGFKLNETKEIGGAKKMTIEVVCVPVAP